MRIKSIFDYFNFTEEQRNYEISKELESIMEYLMNREFFYMGWREVLWNIDRFYEETKTNDTMKLGLIPFIEKYYFDYGNEIFE